jgi:beta-lactamase regulating signal transducer with metallopeptidase domain
MDNSPTINSGIPIIDSAVNPIITDTFKPSYGDSVNPLQVVTYCASIAWIVGMAVLAIHATISYLKIKRKVSEAILVRDNIYKCDSIASPFVLGVIKPRIYLPFGTEECGEEYIISHEMAHIRRKDHIWKPLGYLILTVHWFNPLVWLGYILLCRDIEGACDEKVIKDLNRDERADYSEALLICSLNRRLITACPLAFGEQGVKGRIRFVLNYKKPAFWIIIAALVLTAAISVFFLTNPITHKENLYLTEENMLYGGEGYFTEYEFRNTVNRYTGTCESLEWSSADGAYIKTDFKAVSAEVRVFSPGALEDYGTTTPTHYMIAPIIKGEHDVYVDIGWFYRASEDIQRSNQWSYLVTVTDENDVKHNYYFRVSYDLSVIEYMRIVDSVVYDIDGDGKKETCEIIAERKDGALTVYLSVKKEGSNTVKYYKELGLAHGSSRFVVKTDGLYIDQPNYTSSFSHAPTIRYSFAIANGEIELTKSKTFNTPFIPSLVSVLKEKFGPTEGKKEFEATPLLQGVNLSWSYSIEVDVAGDYIYLNNVSYKASAVLNNIVKYEGALLLDAKEKGLEAVLDKITDADYYYMLKITEGSSQLGKNVAVYEIEGVFYFLTFNESGNVIRIHSY